MDAAVQVELIRIADRLATEKARGHTESYLRDFHQCYASLVGTVEAGKEQAVASTRPAETRGSSAEARTTQAERGVRSVPVESGARQTSAEPAARQDPTQSGVRQVPAASATRGLVSGASRPAAAPASQSVAATREIPGSNGGSRPPSYAPGYPSAGAGDPRSNPWAPPSSQNRGR